MKEAKEDRRTGPRVEIGRGSGPDSEGGCYEPSGEKEKDRHRPDQPRKGQPQKEGRHRCAGQDPGQRGPRTAGSSQGQARHQPGCNAYHAGMNPSPIPARPPWLYSRHLQLRAGPKGDASARRKEP